MLKSRKRYDFMNISKGKKEQLSKALAASLPMLRAKIGISQAELADMVEITRQTVSAFESEQREMPWNMFLAFMMIFTSNPVTKRLLEAMEIYNEDFSQFIDLK